MRIQPVSLQLLGRHVLCPANPAFTDIRGRTADTLERLGHLPLGTGVEEGQDIAFGQGPVVDDPHLHGVHVKDQGRIARVVDEDQVGVELDMRVAAGLHRRVRLGTGRGRGDLGKDGSGGQRGLRDRPAGEGLGTAMDLEERGVRWDMVMAMVVVRVMVLINGVDCNGGHDGVVTDWDED